jgi:hydrogenase maturation factor
VIDREHCPTCADEGVPMRVVSVRDERTAVCESDIEVATELVDEVRPGDTLLVHAGVALAKVPA